MRGRERGRGGERGETDRGEGERHLEKCASEK